MSAPLDQLRTRIDDIDRQIVRLIAERMRSVRKIGESKEGDQHKPLRDFVREKRVLDRWLEEAEKEELSGYYVGRILREMMHYSRRMQEELLDRREHETESVVLRVGFQGIRGSYSDQALTKLFSVRKSEMLDRVGFPSFVRAVDSLEAGDIDYALLPIENTIAGSLNETYQLLADRQVRIVDEEILPVEHCLAGLPGSSVDQVRVVHSHPVALQQCSNWLGQRSDVCAEGGIDTASSAALVHESNDPTHAAICAEETAHALGLEVLARNIADQENNFTRFVLVGLKDEIVDPRRPAKISLVLTVNHRRGSLSRCLDSFARRDINLTKLESRPKPSSPWEYMFYIDIEGHTEDAHVKEALVELPSYTNTIKVLGCYPKRAALGEDFDEADAARTLQSTPKLATESEQPTKAPEIVNSQLRHNGLKPEQSRTVIRIGGAQVGDGHFMLIAGPCAVESRAQIVAAAAMVKECGAHVMRGGAFKPRSSPYSFQGLGFPGLELLRYAGDAFELPIITEVLRVEDVAGIAAASDALQVGARNMQNFELLKKLGHIDKPVLLKRGLSATIDELLAAAEYIMAGGNQQVILGERGIRTFETATRNTLDISAIPVLKQRTHLPVIVDPSHAAGQRELVVPLALAAVAAGADGLIVECHPNPDEALCDKEQALTQADMEILSQRIQEIRGLGALD